MLPPLKKLPGYIGYLIGYIFIVVGWIIEKVIRIFKAIPIKRPKKKYKKR